MFNPNRTRIVSLGYWSGFWEGGVVGLNIRPAIPYADILLLTITIPKLHIPSFIQSDRNWVSLSFRVVSGWAGWVDGMG